MRMLSLRASYEACLACLPLTYSRFCLIIYFVCINQDFAIKRKLLMHVNWANWCLYKSGNSSKKATNIMKTFLEIYLMPKFPKWSDTKFWVSLKTGKLTRLSCEMDKVLWEMKYLYKREKLQGTGNINMFWTVQKLSIKWI